MIWLIPAFIVLMTLLMAFGWYWRKSWEFEE